MSRMRPTLIVLLALLVPASASAGPQLGIEVGGSLVWLSEALEVVGRDPTGRLDWNCAATAGFELTGTSSLVTGLRYSRLGNKFDHDGSTDPSGQDKPGTTTNHHQYVGVPLLFEWKVPGDAVFLLGGTEVAYLVKAASESEYDDGSATTGEIEYTDDMNRLNMTLVGGIGTSIAVGDHALSFTARMAFGLFKTNDNERDLGWKTREFAVTAGFRF